MNESTQKQLLEALRESRSVSEAAEQPKALIGIRVSPGGHFAVAALLTFVSVILLRTHRDAVALLLVTSTWILTPILVATDRLYFDGRALFRSGLLPMLSRLVSGNRPKLALADIERIEVGSVRTLRRGGSVRYRYRVEVSGKTRTFVFVSGGRKFREMIKALLPEVVSEKLDARAIELRDYLCNPKELREQVAQMGIATQSVLEQADETTRKRIDTRAALETPLSDPGNAKRAQSLRQVANNLRIAGRLRESAEAFRRALHLAPRDAWMIYEYARLLRSQASAFSDARLLTRACAALKLSLSRAEFDARLAERIGESFLEFGQSQRASKALRRAIEIDENSFRAHLTLAEIALAEGKLAHVIHHYRDAARIAPDEATTQMARREADYYARLNDDDEYLNAELRRMTWLEGAGRVQQLAARASFAALLIALAGSFVNQFVAGVGWAVASSSIVGWSGALLLVKVLGRRRSARNEL